MAALKYNPNDVSTLPNLESSILSTLSVEENVALPGANHNPPTNEIHKTP